MTPTVKSLLAQSPAGGRADIQGGQGGPWGPASDMSWGRLVKARDPGILCQLFGERGRHTGPEMVGGAGAREGQPACCIPHVSGARGACFLVSMRECEPARGGFGVPDGRFP